MTNDSTEIQERAGEEDSTAAQERANPAESTDFCEWAKTADTSERKSGQHRILRVNQHP